MTREPLRPITNALRHNGSTNSAEAKADVTDFADSESGMTQNRFFGSKTEISIKYGASCVNYQIIIDPLAIPILKMGPLHTV